MYSLLTRDDESRKTEIVKKSFLTSSNYKTIVFVCGKDRKEKDTIRQRFLDHCFSNHIEISPILAEEAADKSLFDWDFLTQERLIASFSGAIVIAVESMGSVCELGSFAYLDSVARKTYVLDDMQYKDNDSFISLGPIEKIKRLGKPHEHIFYFDLAIPKGTGSLEEAFKNCSNVISAKTSFRKDAISFSKGTLIIKDLFWLRLALLELIGLLQTTTLSEVQAALLSLYECKHLALCLDQETSKIKGNQAEAYLKLLISFCEKMNLISQDDKGFIYSLPSNKMLFFPGAEVSSILFNSDFAGSTAYKRILSRRLCYLRRFR